MHECGALTCVAATGLYDCVQTLLLCVKPCWGRVILLHLRTAAAVLGLKQGLALASSNIWARVSLGIHSLQCSFASLQFRDVCSCSWREEFARALLVCIACGQLVSLEGYMLLGS
jgi:hypothetical protein